MVRADRVLLLLLQLWGAALQHQLVVVDAETYADHSDETPQGGRGTARGTARGTGRGGTAGGGGGGRGVVDLVECSEPIGGAIPIGTQGVVRYLTGASAQVSYG